MSPGVSPTGLGGNSGSLTHLFIHQDLYGDSSRPGKWGSRAGSPQSSQLAGDGEVGDTHETRIKIGSKMIWHTLESIYLYLFIY